MVLFSKPIILFARKVMKKKSILVAGNYLLQVINGDGKKKIIATKIYGIH